ncbi:GNAT family N-acetyltransferase [Thalassospira sp. TSL5-1]|uniref:GNAT family N-acetyltransferase n=1 Tax=Thalassospira sp. TSL5-1 TaxID=1544451 RepID=UPI000ABA04B6|nr:GNAT family N-acetyltransferase [Thalassospira sp. TSL5-1]
MPDFRDCILETPRLTLRCVQEADAGQISALMVPEISRWLASWPLPYTEEKAFARIVRDREAAQAGNMLPLVVVERETGAVVGYFSVFRDADDGRRAGAGYWLGLKAHGKGYAREMGPVLLAAAFEMLDVGVIEAGAQPENAASFGVMRSWGMSQAGDRCHYASARERDELCRYFQITRATFESVAV